MSHELTNRVVHWRLVVVAVGIAGSAATAFAEPAPSTEVDRPSLRPVTTHLGWAIDLDAFIQIDSVPWSSESVDELSPSTGKPLDEETLFVRRAFFR